MIPLRIRVAAWLIILWAIIKSPKLFFLMLLWAARWVIGLPFRPVWWLINKAAKA